MLNQSLIQGFAYAKKMFRNSAITKTISSLSYQQFFRQINKSYDAQETIKIFEEYSEMSQKSTKYLTLTLRMFTRILKKAFPKENYIINHFIEKNFTAIKAIESANLPIDDLKNMMLFAISHVSSCKGIVTDHFIQFTRSIISTYLQQFQQLKEADQLINIQNIISAIKPIATCFSDLTDSYSSVLMKFYIQRKEDLVVENLTFKTTLQALEHSFTITNTAIFPFVQEIATHILRQKMIPALEHTTLAYLINLCYKCSEQSKMRGIQLQPQVEEIILMIDQYFINTLSALSGHSIEVLLPLLLKNNPKGKFVSHYYSIIALSVNQRGQTCLHPLLIIRSLSYLSSSHNNLLTDVNSNWEQSFVKMLALYYHSKNKFEKNITDLLFEISSKRLLQTEHQLSFRKFCNQFKPYKNGNKTLQQEQNIQNSQLKSNMLGKVGRQPISFFSKEK